MQYEISDPREKIERFVDHVFFRAGGFVDDAKIGTHYSRTKLSHVFPVGQPIIIRIRLELPDNFYENHRASFKLATIGTKEPYQRALLWIDSRGYPRLQTEKKDSLLRTLWTSTRRLPTGKSLVRLLAIPSAIEGQGLLRLSVNGVKWGETKAPNLLDPSHTQIDRIVIGVDGAADADFGNPISLTIWEIEIK